MRHRFWRLGGGLFGLWLLSVLAVLATPAAAQEILRIAAVVNDEVISAHDLEQRITLVISSAGLRDSPETRRRLRDQVLRNLIDERVQLQEAVRLNITVTDDELDRAIGYLEQQNNVPSGRFEEFLYRQGIEKDSLLQQLRAEIAWSKVIRRRLLPTINISEEEVENTLARLQASRGVTETQVSEILLSVDSPDLEDEVRRSAERLVEQLRRGGNFAAVARQFSQGTTAAAGGDIGWVQPGVLPEEIDAAVAKLQEGEVSDPIRTVGGYYIIQVRGRRQPVGGGPGDNRVSLKQIMLPLARTASAAEVEAATRQVQEMAGSVDGCEALASKIEELGSRQSGDLGELRIRDLPEPFQPVVAKLPIGKLSEPLRSDSGIHLLMVCDRTEAEANLPSAEDVRNGLINRRAGLMARRYMRDLRRDAVVEFR